MSFVKVKPWHWGFLVLTTVVLVLFSNVFSNGGGSGLLAQLDPPSVRTGQQLPITAYTQIGLNRIELEIAATPEQQEIGLMHRTWLADNRGMLFPFSPPRPVGFWMKNCLIALDIVFIRQQRVVGIAENAPPCRQDPCPTYNSPTSVDYVLELAAGRAKSLGLKPGDSIVIQPISSQPSLPSQFP